jgi:hypothetical protein
MNSRGRKRSRAHRVGARVLFVGPSRGRGRRPWRGEGWARRARSDLLARLVGGFCGRSRGSVPGGARLGRLEQGRSPAGAEWPGLDARTARAWASGVRLGRLGSSASVGILHGGCEQEGEKGGEREAGWGGGWEEEDSGWLGLGEAGAAASLLGPGGPIRLGLVRFFFFFFLISFF